MFLLYFHKMKKIIILILIMPLIFSCEKDEVLSQCSYLANIGVNYEVNLNLPQYNQLNFISNSVHIPNIGNGGVIVTNSGTGYLAWDASDPNHINSTCSIMVITGLESKCNCPDENSYSLITGQSLGIALECGLKAYRVEVNGNNLFISNL
jgi:nitrite reductase/ring-hydroxylating ferredoxin subunit